MFEHILADDQRQRRKDAIRADMSLQEQVIRGCIAAYNELALTPLSDSVRLVALRRTIAAERAKLQTWLLR